MNLPECQNQDPAGREANIHKASLTERRLFYPNRPTTNFALSVVEAQLREVSYLKINKGVQ